MTTAKQKEAELKCKIIGHNLIRVTKRTPIQKKGGSVHVVYEKTVCRRCKHEESPSTVQYVEYTW